MIDGKRVIGGVQFIFIGFLALLYGSRGMLPPWEILLTLVVCVLFLGGRLPAWGLALAPFFLIATDYFALRKYVASLSLQEIHVSNLIEWERQLFGGVLPPLWFQQHFHQLALTPFLDLLANALYLLHFPLPAIFALWLYRKSQHDYWWAMSGLTVLSVLGFATYLLFPAAPPWWASQRGLIPEGSVSLSHFVSERMMTQASPTPVAAIPSLHAGFALYFSWIAVLVGGRKLLWILLLPLGVAWATVYLGHHYVVDALAGFLFCGVVVLPWQVLHLRFRPSECGSLPPPSKAEASSSTPESLRSLAKRPAVPDRLGSDS